MDLFRLSANRPAGRGYRGGRQIMSFRGLTDAADDLPEDWMASTVPVYGEASVGRTILDNGKSLNDVITADPIRWLGEDHVKRAGPDTQLLVKLLDAGQRLPVHVHPDDTFARDTMHRQCGKTEAWFVLGHASVHLGFTREIGADELASWVETQDTVAMLNAMNDIELASGTTVVVPAGIPHAIGEGGFLVEVQQPTDLSILMEWKGFADSQDEGVLGLGFAQAMDAVDRREWDPDALARLIHHPGNADVGVQDILSSAADPFFRLQRIVVDSRNSTKLDAGYSVIVVLEGHPTVTCENGQSAHLTQGDTILVAHRAGELTIGGQAELLRCRPPEHG